MLEQKWSDKAKKVKELRDKIEQQIMEKDWSNAESTMEELSKLNVNIKGYQSDIKNGKRQE